MTKFGKTRSEEGVYFVIYSQILIWKLMHVSWMMVKNPLFRKDKSVKCFPTTIWDKFFYAKAILDWNVAFGFIWVGSLESAIFDVASWQYTNWWTFYHKNCCVVLWYPTAWTGPALRLDRTGVFINSTTSSCIASRRVKTITKKRASKSPVRGER